MRILKSKRFANFARKEGLPDEKLRHGVKDAKAGKIDADYGGGLIKQRIARPGEGKSGGYRAIMLYRRGDKAFFVYGIPKSERDNIDEAEERAFKDLGKLVFAATAEPLDKLVKDGKFLEVKSDG